MSEELKPCPLCGGPAFIVQIGNEFTKTRGFDVGCKACVMKIQQRAIRHPLAFVQASILKTWKIGRAHV